MRVVEGSIREGEDRILGWSLPMLPLKYAPTRAVPDCY